jgi:hypothetical protein
MPKPKKAAKKKVIIKVLLGELVKPLVIKECEKGTTLIKFLEDNGIAWSSAIRVGGETQEKSYKLRSRDVITTIGSVSGGRQ